MSGTDTSLTCVQCGTPFTFSASEQAFYAERGFTLPKRCKPCRDELKRQREGGGPSVPRTLYDVVCAQCGVETQVPFKPSGSKPVLCRTCFRH